MAKIERMIENAKVDVEMSKKELLRSMRELSQELTRAADHLEDNDGVPNSLGIVRGQGTTIDRKIVELIGQRAILIKLQVIAKHLAEEDDEAESR